MGKKNLSFILISMLLFLICAFGGGGVLVSTADASAPLADGAGFIGYASLSGDIVTITSKLYGPLANLATAKFGITYKKDKVDMLKTDGTTIVNAYQNSDFLADATISTFATYSNIPTGYRKTIKVLVHSLPTVYYASVGFDKVSSEQLSINYSPAAGNEFTTIMKFKIKTGQATDLASIKSYFNLSGEVSAPTLIVTEGKKYIPVIANFADAYLAPAMAHLDYNAIGPDTTPAPSPVTNPSRTAPPAALGTTFISQDTFDFGMAGVTAAPGDTANLTNIFTRRGTGSDKYLYFDKTWPAPTPQGYSSPSIRYNFVSSASGPFTVEFDYLPVAESNAGISLAVSGKDNNGTSTEKSYIHILLTKQYIYNMAGYIAGNSNAIFDYNTDA